MEIASCIVSDAAMEEQMAHDALPESIQCSDRGDRMEEVVSNLEEATSLIDEATQIINEAVV